MHCVIDVVIVILNGRPRSSAPIRKHKQEHQLIVYNKKAWIATVTYNFTLIVSVAV